MREVMLVGLGGFFGAIFRYLLLTATERMPQLSFFPFGTLAVNALGCLLAGVIFQLCESRGIFSPSVRLFVLIGLLGGFTTFSTFTMEAMNLYLAGQRLVAGLCVTSNLVLCAVGFLAARKLMLWILA